MHCHILEHEDQGAMGWADVIGGFGPPSFPQDGDISPPYSAYNSLDPGTPPAAPTGLVANATSSSAINLDWLDNSTDEDSFEIERSPDGTSFSGLNFVGADVTTYTDTNLDAETTYFYRVRAANASGVSAYSNVASATTDPIGQATSVQVSSIIVSTPGIGQGFKIGRAEVVVEDDQGGLVSGAVVSGEFTGTFVETITASDPTDANGLTIMDTAGSAKGNLTVTFCVTGITHPTLQDFAAQPGAVCGMN